MMIHPKLSRRLCGQEPRDVFDQLPEPGFGGLQTLISQACPATLRPSHCPEPLHPPSRVGTFRGSGIVLAFTCKVRLSMGYFRHHGSAGLPAAETLNVRVSLAQLTCRLCLGWQAEWFMPVESCDRVMGGTSPSQFSTIHDDST